MTWSDPDTRRDEVDDDPGQLGPDSGGQSGDTQGLAPMPDEADGSVEELADTGQAYEAEVMEGVEDAADHPERPVHTREDQGRLLEVAPDRGSE
jgi:hypothetical protein